MKRRAFSGAPWESRVGYCRAVRVGDHIVVTGTAPVADDGSVFAPGDATAQTRRCLDIIERALGELDASMSDVVRTRLFEGPKHAIRRFAAHTAPGVFDGETQAEFRWAETDDDLAPWMKGRDRE